MRTAGSPEQLRSSAVDTSLTSGSAIAFAAHQRRVEGVESGRRSSTLGLTVTVGTDGLSARWLVKSADQGCHSLSVVVLALRCNATPDRKMPRECTRRPHCEETQTYTSYNTVMLCVCE